jgi:hypothetical protein
MLVARKIGRCKELGVVVGKVGVAQNNSPKSQLSNLTQFRWVNMDTCCSEITVL